MTTTARPSTGARSRAPIRRLLEAPADPLAMQAMLAVADGRAADDRSKVLVWGRRCCCVTDDLAPLSLRRILKAAEDLSAEELRRWANSSTEGRRFPWVLVAAALVANWPRQLDKAAANVLELRLMGDIFAKLLCALSRRAGSPTVKDGNNVAYIQVTTLSVLENAGLIAEHDAFAEHVSRYFLWTRRAASRGRHRSLARNWARAIGHVVVLAHVLAGQRLGLFDDRGIRVMRGPVSNRYLLGLIERSMEGLTFVDGVEPFTEPYTTSVLEQVNGELLDLHEMCGVVARAADPVGGAVLQVPEQDRGELAAYLASVGPCGPRGFVTVHCRETGYRVEERHRLRNARIADYLPALKRLVDLGYTVVRLGDRSMAHLPETPGIVDYAHSAAKSAKLDVLLVAGAAFHIGSSSGMSLVPMMFGTPCLFLNWYPTKMLTWGPRTWTVLKTLCAAGSGDRVEDPAVIHEVGRIPDGDVVGDLGYRVDDLSADEIVAAVEAYLAFLSGPGEVERRSGARPSATAPVFRFGPGNALVEVPSRRRSGAEGAAGLP